MTDLPADLIEMPELTTPREALRWYRAAAQGLDLGTPASRWSWAYFPRSVRPRANLSRRPWYTNDISGVLTFDTSRNVGAGPTVGAPQRAARPCVKNDIKGLSVCLNSRFWKPDSLDVRVVELRSDKRNQWPQGQDDRDDARRPNNRRIQGARYCLTDVTFRWIDDEVFSLLWAATTKPGREAGYFPR
jgi:hypothetical protein